MEEKKKNSVAWYILAGLYTIIAAAFLINVFRLNILPGTYFAAVAAVVVIISAIIIKSLVAGKAEKAGKKVAAVIAVILMLLMGVGTWYVAGMVDFVDEISQEKSTSVNYHVVVKMESSYEEIADLKGKTAGVMGGDDSQDKRARAQLEEQVKIEITEKNDYLELAQGLLDGEFDAILINAGLYEMALEDVDGFTEETVRILGTIETDQAEAEKTDVETKKSRKKPDVTSDTFSVYISGIDTTGSISNVSRSDVNMVVTVNPKTKKILLTSIPRDYHVVLASKGAYDKLTHSGIYGVNETVSTVENLLDMNIDYYVKVNFTTVTKLVDALGGITVNSEYSFRAGGFDFNAGLNELNGKQALAFARERYSFAYGDNQRLRNQQAVITGIINKATGSTAILTSYNELLNALKENMDTNFTSKEITSLVKMQLSDMSSWTIETCSLSGYGNMTSVYSMPSSIVYVMEPNMDSVNAAKAKISEMM